MLFFVIRPGDAAHFVSDSSVGNARKGSAIGFNVVCIFGLRLWGH